MIYSVSALTGVAATSTVRRARRCKHSDGGRSCRREAHGLRVRVTARPLRLQSFAMLQSLQEMEYCGRERMSADVGDSGRKPVHPLACFQPYHAYYKPRVQRKPI